MLEQVYQFGLSLNQFDLSQSGQKTSKEEKAWQKVKAEVITRRRACALLALKKLEIEKTNPIFIISVLKVEY